MKTATLTAIVDALTRAGFVAAGQTAQEIVRVPTVRSPLYGNTGGERRTFGGRQRYTKPGTNVRVTIGPRTVNVYRVVDGKTEFLANLKTNKIDLDELFNLLSTC